MAAGTAAEVESILSRLRIGVKLGGGAAGDVFAGLLDDEEVAVKIVRGPVSSATTRRVKREAWVRERRTALALARHPHPHTLRCFAAFEAPAGCKLKQVASGDGLLIMERGMGVDLPVGVSVEVLGPLLLDEEGRVAAALRAGRIAVSILAALAHMHGVVKVIHRDVKPDNLLMVEDGRICLCDFSAARTQLYTFQRAGTKAGIGTMGYLAPEMYDREARYCSKVDMWSLGVTTLQYYNCGKPCKFGDFHRLTSLLQFRRDRESVAEACEHLDEVISQELWEQLPEEEGPVAALRELLRHCFRADPGNRPGAAALLKTPEALSLSLATELVFDVPKHDIELLEGAVEQSLTVANLMHELMWRFSSNEKPGIDELNLLRDGLHRSLEEKDERSLELLECWVRFVRDCPGVTLMDQDVTTGRSLMHAVVQNHRQETLLEMMEDAYQEDGCPLPITLLNTPDEDGRTPLSLACENAISAPVSLRLVELAADVNAPDAEGITPLEHCAGRGFNRPGECREDVLTVLIAFGAKPPPRLLENEGFIPNIRKALKLSTEEAQSQVEVWQAEAERARKLRYELCSLEVSEGQPSLADGAKLGASEEVDSCATAVPEEETVEGPAMVTEEAEDEGEEAEEEAEEPAELAEGELEPTRRVWKKQVTAAENQLKAHLLVRAGNHVMTAFRLCRRAGARKVQVDDLIKTLREAMPEEDVDALEERFRDRWSKGLTLKEFTAWIQGPSKATVDARRHLPTQAPRRGSARGPKNSSTGRTTPTGRPKSRAARDRAASPRPSSRPSSPFGRRPSGLEPERVAGLKGKAGEEARIRGALIQLFWRLDVDGSTVLDLEQFTRGYKLLMEHVEGTGEPSAAFEAADANGSNDVDEDEWLTWTMCNMLPELETPGATLARRLESWLKSTDVC